MPADQPDLPDLLKIPPVARNPWMRVALALGGFVCLILGVVGWLVPVVTGVPFYILGAVLLGMAHPPLGHWINRKERGFSRRVRLLLRPRLRRELAAEAEAEAGTETETGAGAEAETETGAEAEAEAETGSGTGPEGETGFRGGP